MPQVCSICSHSHRTEIDRALVGGAVLRNVAQQHGLTVWSVKRHRDAHLPESLVKAEEARETAHSIDIMGELTRAIERVERLSDACDRWLRDPEDPDRYDVGPRAEDVSVIYTEQAGERTARRKERLSVLLDRLEKKRPGLVVEQVETKHADPRELLLKAYDRLESRLELLAKLLGDLQQEGTVNLIVSPDWLRLRARIVAALAPYPEASTALVAALEAGE